MHADGVCVLTRPEFVFTSFIEAIFSKDKIGTRARIPRANLTVRRLFLANGFEIVEEARRVNLVAFNPAG